MAAGPSNFVTQYPDVSAPLDGTCQRANAGYLAPGQTKIAINLDTIANAGSGATTTVPLPTPPAGKSWLITDIFISHDAAVALRCAITVGGITVFSAPVKGDTAPLAMPGIETQIDIPELVSASITLKGQAGAAATNFYVNLIGVQQPSGAG